jgi:peptide/nickel transport system substrate-binding protein
MKIGPDLRIVPDLAVRFETTDFATYTAAIPPGVHFHNGKEMTSADVAYTFRRLIDPKFVSGRKGAFRDLASVNVVDRYTVRFDLKAPSAAFPSALAYMGIVAEGAGPETARTPIGSGPYRVTEFAVDDHVTLEAFPEFHRGRPKNNGLVIKVIPDETMRGLELRNGSVDLVVNDVSPDLVYSLGQEPSLEVLTGPGTDYAYIGLNLRDPVLADLRVRQAIAQGIDRQEIASALRRGQARPSRGIIPSMSWAYSADLPEFTPDYAGAMALLDQAGYRDPDGPGPQMRLRLTLKTSTAEAYRLQATVLQAQLARVGIGVDIRSYEFATLFSDIVRGTVQMYTLVFTGGSVADPDILRRVFHSSQTPPNGFNRAWYHNPEVDRLLEAASAATTEDDRRRFYVEAQRIIARDLPIVSLWTRENVAIQRRGLAGVRLSPIADFEFLRDVVR